MRSVTLIDALTRIYRRADLENATDRFPKSEVIDEYNESLAALYDRILRARGQEYFEKSTPITTTSNVATYDLPSDFYEIISIELNVAGYAYKLRRFDREQRAYLGSTALSFSGEYFRYMVHGKGTYSAADTIEFLPIPASNSAVTLFYVPCAAKLAADGDTFDGVNGWEEYAILDAASKLLVKNRKLDAATAIAQMREVIGQRIDGLVPRRDVSGPGHVTDVRQTRVRWRRTTV